MYKNIIALWLSLLLLISCDSEQSEKVTDTTKKVPSVEQAQKVQAGSTKNTEQPVVDAAEKTVAVAPEKSQSESPRPVTEQAAAMSGEQVYKTTCQNCHASGAAGSPKLNDKANWKPRIAKGVEALYLSAIKGVPSTAMMPKGTCSKCSEQELRNAVDYMLAKVNSH